MPRSLLRQLAIIETVTCKAKKNMSKKIIRSKYFKYPTSEESERLSDKLPTYKRFQFSPVNIVESTFQGQKPLKETHRIHNLHHWNKCLSNRLGKLKQTHLFLLTHYEREFKENHLECNEEQLVDRILFDYYSEIFYYFFFSVLDSIAQILNIYFKIDKEDNKVYFKKFFFEQIQNEEIRKLLNTFIDSTGTASDYRNSLTHRFPINEKDFRSEINEANGNTELSIKGGNVVETKSLISNIKSYFNSTFQFFG